LIYLLTIWTAFTFSLQDTVPQPALPDTIPQAALPDTLFRPSLSNWPLKPVSANTIPKTAEADSSQIDGFEAESQRPDTVYVWEYNMRNTMDVAETDSTLRWINMVNLFDRFYDARGAITYRLGTSGRPDGLELHTYETRHLNMRMEGLSLNNPLTGAVYWNRIPIRKIKEYREADYGAAYHGEIKLIDHYLTQPRTYLNFDESKYNYRNLDFVFTQNFRADTNLEFSYWDRRDGGGYSRSGVEGRQASVKIYHQLTDRWLLKTLYLNNALDREESFGYAVNDPELFTFNTFTESPIENNANSNQTSSDIYIQAHHRPDTQSAVQTEFGLHYQTNKWSLNYSADSIATEFKQAELFSRHRLNLGRTDVTLQGSVNWLNESVKQNLTEDSWLGARGRVDLNIRPLSWIDFQSYSTVEYWDDERFSSEASGRITFFPGSKITLSGFGGYLNRSPDLQALYWQSSIYTGDPTLENEQEISIGGMIEFQILNWLKTGLRADLRLNENSVFINEINQFENIDSFTNMSGTGWIGLDSRIFEGELSAVYKSFLSDSDNPVNRQLEESGDRIWLKGNFYWKNYLFDRATYVKAGISGMMSPGAFNTAEYITPLNRWQHGTNSLDNPSYYRMDVDVSARIRWFMLLLKWENVLDGVNQLGYFESTGYPMPERRFRLGLRILFTN
jgi:hypothetical protein